MAILKVSSPEPPGKQSIANLGMVTLPKDTVDGKNPKQPHGMVLKP